MKQLFITILLLCSLKSFSQLGFTAESGWVSTGYNDVRIPGTTGTFISLKNDLEAQSEIYYRLQFKYQLKERHHFILLYAPLTIKSSGQFASDVRFDQTVFPRNTETESDYKFNSYRITYRYDFVLKPSFEAGIGFTAKIRDANIELKNAQTSENYSNVGFVPILNFRLLWNPTEKTGILLEGDALASKQGRAEDVLLAALYRFTENIAIYAGYRLLEGGADNSKVYTFSMFNYAAIGLSIGL